MSITYISGPVSSLSETDAKGMLSCKIDGQAAILADELAKDIKDGDRILVAGEMHDAALSAMALRHGEHGPCRTLDASNIAIILSFSLFIGVITGIMALQEVGSGDTAAQLFLGTISLVSFGYTSSLLLRVFKISRASRCVQFGRFE